MVVAAALFVLDKVVRFFCGQHGKNNEKGQQNLSFLSAGWIRFRPVESGR